MAQSSSAISIQVVLSIFRITPLLVFLILIPAIEFRTVGQNRYLWLALSSLVVIGAMVYVRIEFLHDPETIFVLPKFMMWLFYVILLWTPIILSIVLFPVKPLVFMKN
jgi:hypothetical protein